MHKLFSLLALALCPAASWAAAAETTPTTPITWDSKITLPDQATLAKQLKAANFQMMDIGVASPLSAQLGGSTKTVGEIVTIADAALAAMEKAIVHETEVSNPAFAAAVPACLNHRRPALHQALFPEQAAAVVSVLSRRGVYDLPLGVTLVIE